MSLEKRSIDGNLGLDISHTLLKDIGTMTHSQLESSITTLNTSLSGKEDTANKNTSNGYAGLDSTGLIPLSRLPVTASTTAAGLITGLSDASRYILVVGSQPTFTPNTNTSITLYGQGAGASITNANSVIGIGRAAMATVTSNGINIGIGDGADVTDNTINYAIALGSGTKVGASNEFRVTDNIYQMRMAGLTSHSSIATNLAIDSNGIIKKSAGMLAWGARADNNTSISYVSGTASVFISTWTTEYGSTSYLTNKRTFTVPAIAPSGALWELNAQTYLTSPSNISSLILEVIRNNTVYHQWEIYYNSTNFQTRGGTLTMKLNPGNTIELRLSYVSSGTGSWQIASLGSIFQMKMLSHAQY